MKKKFCRALWASFAFLASCHSVAPPKTGILEQVSYSDLDGWPKEQFAALLPMVKQQCAVIAHLPPTASLGGDASVISSGTKAEDWRAPCEALTHIIPSTEAIRAYFETWFAPYRITDGLHLRGYYEPEVRASRFRTERFTTPIYRKPDDLVRAFNKAGHLVTGRWVDLHWMNLKFYPYYSRAEIDRGALHGKKAEIAWVQSPIDVFLLQLQGMGRLRMTDGSVKTIAFSARNGRPYVPIGRLLVRKHYIDASQVTLSTIRNWLVTHPKQALPLIEQDADYVFFREVLSQEEQQGAPGALGVALVPYRSLAVDHHVIPLGLPLWIETRWPGTYGEPTHLHHVVFASDSSGDIRGMSRADIFVGWGEFADAIATDVRSFNQAYLLLPRPPPFAKRKN